jgi:hypothetical protein
MSKGWDLNWPERVGIRNLVLVRIHKGVQQEQHATRHTKIPAAGAKRNSMMVKAMKTNPTSPASGTGTGTPITVLGVVRDIVVVDIARINARRAMTPTAIWR